MMKYWTNFSENGINHPMYLKVLDDKSLQEIGIKNIFDRKIIAGEALEFVKETQKFEEWLKEINLESFFQCFSKNGLTSLKRLKCLREAEKVPSDVLRLACGIDDRGAWELFWRGLGKS